LDFHGWSWTELQEFFQDRQIMTVCSSLRQPSAYRANLGSECYVIDRFIGTIAEWSEYCILLDAV